MTEPDLLSHLDQKTINLKSRDCRLKGITLSLPFHLHERLCSFADRRKLSLSAYLRAIIEIILEEEERRMGSS